MHTKHPFLYDFWGDKRSCKSYFYIDDSDKFDSQSVLLDFIPVQEAGALSRWHAFKKRPF